MHSYRHFSIILIKKKRKIFVYYNENQTKKSKCLNSLQNTKTIMAIAALFPKPLPHFSLFPSTNIIHQQPPNVKKPQNLLVHPNLIPSQTVGSGYRTSTGWATLFWTSDKSQNPNFHKQRFIITIPFSSFRNSSTPPPENQIDCPVPFEQQPINEYQALSESFPFSWASGDFLEYCSRLFAVGTSFAVFVGLPVSFGSVGVEISTLERFLAALSTGLFVVTLAVVRMYLGWAYVGNRLLSATVEYEETGWYDGQVWVKTAEILARDRLLGSFSVKPVLNRLKNTLVILGTSLFICAVVFVTTESSQKETYRISKEPGGRAVPGVYNDESARSFEPDAFCGEPGDIG